ncbi:DUF7678 domain-containing protein [Paenibacillus polymyxa]|uniref:DUF7678 domain-containing protein n=1 Tax=Paenibacillus polymyxa TaxID=1406 RepID=UPI00111A3C00|nr:hypothetical protein [Paenibacillus polymyxa]QDA30195.1 hypothetical protein FGY93_25065 [Paenibacillus polymyxa]
MLNFKRDHFTGKLYDGEVDGYYVMAQIFEPPSHYGIAEGRISRLYIFKNREASKYFLNHLINYDRGWDGGAPHDARIRGIIEKLVQYYDQKQVDWSFEESRSK